MASRSRAAARPAERRRAPADPLARYRGRRDFARTPEPPGTDERRAPARLYVVQKHAARRLHYDLRLQLGDALKSWAVTRGPSLDPAERRLAVHVEDHPLAYGDFEGVIPQGEYGGGTVMVWDTGTWSPVGDAEAGYARGRLRFRLHGRRLRGGWLLVRMGRARRESQDPWLLIKERDEHARPGSDPLAADDRSALSGRTLREITAAGDDGGRAAAPAARSERRTAPAPPKFVRPQLATLVERAPAGAAWLHELKHDGYRCQVRVAAGAATVRSRGGHDWTARFPGIAAATRALPASGALLDGEAVVLDADGVSRFDLLRHALAAGDDRPVLLYAFDLLCLDGEDLRARPLHERKRRLEALVNALPPGGRLRYSDHVVGRGAELWEHACRLGAEGIVAKRADAPYRSGRSAAWLKVKCPLRREVVVGGYTPRRGRTSGLGALLVGAPAGADLVYAGKVGTGWSEAQAAALLAALEPLRSDGVPFRDVPPPERRRVRWVRPERAIRVRFAGWTTDGRLRHASYEGLVEDGERPTRPAAGAPPPGASFAGVRISSPERLVLDDPPLTKADVADYYAAAAGRLLPHIVGRPLSVVRCPSGVGGGCFYQRHRTAGLSAGVRPVELPGEEAAFFAITDATGLMTLVQFGAFELHPWGARADRPERPDRLVFDLDPGDGVPWARVVEAAWELRARLERLGLAAFAKTTGGKGLHVVVPIDRRHDWPAAKAFAATLARAMAADSPERYTASLTKAARRGRIFIDYLRNDRRATAVAPYSLRARAGAPVALPVAWDELTPALDPARFTATTVHDLLGRRPDPWAELSRIRQRLPRGAPPRAPRATPARSSPRPSMARSGG